MMIQVPVVRSPSEVLPVLCASRHTFAPACTCSRGDREKNTVELQHMIVNLILHFCNQQLPHQTHQITITSSCWPIPHFPRWIGIFIQFPASVTIHDDSKDTTANDIRVKPVTMLKSGGNRTSNSDNLHSQGFFNDSSPHGSRTGATPPDHATRKILSKTSIPLAVENNNQTSLVDGNAMWS